MNTKDAHGELPRVMIVDDVPDNLRLLEAMLTGRGYRVFALPSGQMALKAAAIDKPDIILLDILMPEMDGYEVCARFKADPFLRDIPIIFLSALSDTANKIRGFQAGGVDYIPKPFQIEEVEARVRAQLDLLLLRRKLAEHNTLLEATVQERTMQLAEANVRLSRLDEAKSDFLGIISHELRTPLHGICGVAQLLFMELPDTPKMDNYRQIFEQSQQRILDLVNDALLLTEIETSPEQYKAQTCQLDTVLKDAFAQTAEANHKSGVVIAPMPAATGSVVGKASLLSKAMSCLLLTASKLAQRGTVVTITLANTPGASGLAIHSAGNCIPQNRLADFFDPLSISNPITSGGDLGLAPAVARSLLKAFGGQVTVENTQPAGVRFSVTFHSAPKSE